MDPSDPQHAWVQQWRTTLKSKTHCRKVPVAELREWYRAIYKEEPAGNKPLLVEQLAVWLQKTAPQTAARQRSSTAARAYASLWKDAGLLKDVPVLPYAHEENNGPLGSTGLQYDSLEIDYFNHFFGPRQNNNLKPA